MSLGIYNLTIYICYNMGEIKILLLDTSPHIRAALSEILVEVVANGGSVSFMHPLEIETADKFWENSLAAVSEFSQNLSAVSISSGCIKLTEPPFATTSTRISLSAARMCGEVSNNSILISPML